MTSATYSISAFYVTLEMLIYVLLMLFICSVNMITIITVGINRKMWTVPNMYVVSLATADFLTGLQVIYGLLPLFPTLQVVFDRSKWLCLCKHSALFTVVTTSILNMVIIAVDRWAFISHPFFYTRTVTVKKAIIIIIVSWIIGLLLGTVSLYINNWNNDCRFYKVINADYQLYVQGTAFVVSSLIIVACYTHIFVIVVRQRAIIMKQKKLFSNDGVASSVDSKKTSDRKLQRLRKDSDLVKMFGIMFGVFFCCTAPCMVCGILTHKLGILYGATYITIPLLMLNSGMNFFIYVFRNRQFKMAVRATLNGCHQVFVKPSWTSASAGFSTSKA